jgi:hypothetical protein
MKPDKTADLIFGTATVKKVIHRGYSATERQIGTVHQGDGGYRIVSRRKIPRFLRWLYDGKVWEFIGEKGG